ncbi:MAG: DUF4256 domain-containing protein [Chloroflexota bacterium]
MAKKGSGKPIPKVVINLNISPVDVEELISTLKARFEQNMNRHPDLEWSLIAARLEKASNKVASLHAMEATGGEPDVVGFDEASGEYIFYDCAPQSPDGRRKICFDQDGEDQRTKKGLFPAGNAVALAEAMGVEILNEEAYRALQALGEFDTKTSTWIVTPTPIRERGGALFAERRYDHVFVYHNGAQSFYSDRGFRGSLRV